MSSSEFVFVRIRPARTLVFIALSSLLHLALWLALVDDRSSEPRLLLSLPDQVEFGIAQPTPEPGAQGSPPPAAAPEAPKAPPRPTHPKIAKPIAKRDDDSYAIANAKSAAASEPAAASGEGEGVGASGAGLGFGAGGFGSGAGDGVIIGLHADLELIRSSSLVLETRALLQLIPEWEKLLKGSGVEPLKHLSRVFVASPNLKRSDLVVSARFRGGAAFMRGAAERLAEERGEHASFETRDGLTVAPWFSHGPTEREVALVAPNQFVIARPRDVPRVMAVSAALARRQAKQAEMEQAEGPGSLLAMYEGEAAALSIENARKFVSGDNAYVPLALRISLAPLDEYHAKLRVYGYYENKAAAEHALARIDALRHELAVHPTVQYFGLRSAIDEAELTHAGDTLRLDTVVTLHQTRYLMAFVRKALAPRDAPAPTADAP